MTQKELLYFEDAIEHEEIICSILEDMLDTLEDEDLISFINKELDKHNDTKESLINLLEDKQDE